MAEFLSTREIAAYLKLNEKKIYAMAAEGSIPSVRVSGKWLFPREVVDEWLLGRTHIPESQLMDNLLDHMIVLQGSDDWLLDQALDLQGDGVRVVSARVGSLAGLDAVTRGTAHIAASHVLSDQLRTSGPGRDSYVLDLFTRVQGFMGQSDRLLPGSMAGILEQRLPFAARQEASGTWALTRRLVQAEPRNEADLNVTVRCRSHLGVARAVKSGLAVVGLGSQVAAELLGLAFQPVEEECFSLAIPARLVGAPSVVRFLERILDLVARGASGWAPGYGLQVSGRLRPMSQV